MQETAGTRDAAGGPAVNSQYRYAAVLSEALRQRARWLDLGCGHAFLPSWMQGDSFAPPAETVIVGIDLDRDALRAHAGLQRRLVGDVQQLPVADASFDLVTANMVVEHLSDPGKFFGEVSRVLRPGGLLVVHTPNSRGYTSLLARCVPSSWRPRVAHLLQGRDARDVYPTHYKANTLDALRRLAIDNQLEVAELVTLNSSAQFFNVPAVRWLEDRFLAALLHPRLGRWRPCIIGRFVKHPSAGDASGADKKPTSAAGRRH
jgi:ubiquinone/menaquinone biosynthesis C-methylase UbiE